MALVFLRAIAPFRRFARGGFELLDFLAERIVSGDFGVVLPVQARLKRVVIPLHDVGVRLVQADHMVNRAVEESAVVADEQEAVFAAKVVRQHRASGRVQRIGGFVDERIGILAGEERRQHHAGLFAAGERVERAVERLVRHIQQGQFARQAPILARRRGGLGDLPCGLRAVRDGVREQHGHQRAVDFPFAVQIARQQAQKSGLAASVAGDKTRAPRRIEGQGQVGKDGFGGAVVGE